MRVRELVRATFQWRRKQLRKILRDHPSLNLDVGRVEATLEDLGIAPEVRPENLTPESFVALSEALG